MQAWKVIALECGMAESSIILREFKLARKFMKEARSSIIVFRNERMYTWTGEQPVTVR